MSKPTINTQHTASYAQLYELLSVAANAIKACISKKDLEDAHRATAAALVQLSEQTANNQTAIEGKVDKVMGKGLSQNDFTDDLKARLEGLNNYNDAEVRGLITSLQSSLDTLSGTNDTTDVIDSMNEIKAFLDKFKNNTKLSNVLATLEETIKAWVEAKGYLTTHQDISGKADVNHTHSEYADKEHSHSYNDLTDKPSLFDGNYDSLTNKPTIPTVPSSLPANGGNADTVDGKHATDFAKASHTHTQYADKDHSHSDYAEKNHTHAQYLTTHQDITGKADVSTVDQLSKVLAMAIVNLSEQGTNNATAITTKVDKELGKGLSTNDFTNDLKARLESLSNYNDTELRSMVASLQSSLDAITGTDDTTDAIDTMNEVKAFLDSFKNNKDLSQVLATLEATIHTWVEQKGYLTQHQDISGKADANHNHDGVYAEKNHTHSQYLTQHQSLDGKADKSEVDTLTQVISAAIVQLAEQIANNSSSLSTKVDKVSGKGLSQNDYSDADKAKLDGIDPTSFASKNHSHSEYATSNHTHDNYADKSHTHSGYAASNHTHDNYADKNHSHLEYATANHSHSGYVGTSDSRLSDSRPSSDVYAWAKLQGTTTATSIENIPITHRLVVATISANATFSLSSVPVGGVDIHVIIRNTGSSDISITLPTEGNYLVGGDSTITIEAGKFGEVSAVSDGTTIYLRGI